MAAAADDADDDGDRLRSINDELREQLIEARVPPMQQWTRIKQMAPLHLHQWALPYL